MSNRISTAIESGQLVMPDDGLVRVFGATPDLDLSAVPSAQCEIVQPFRPAFDALKARGFETVTEPSDARPAATIVLLPRAKPYAKALIAEAVEQTDGWVAVDGAKTDGIASIVRDLKRWVPLAGSLSKAHGKLIWFDATETNLPDFASRDWPLVDGFKTVPGVFSADGIDPASALLMQALPARLGRVVADLGAGWGYLSAKALETDRGIETIHLVEADARALDCARINVPNPRAQMHWADARTWNASDGVDAVITNPPFHTGRVADPDLGRTFIISAARLLRPKGALWLVANRHLPYEATLSDHFGQVQEISGTGSFKVLHAQRPSRPRA